MSIFLRDRTNTHLVRPEWDDRVPPTPITDLAWGLLWDVEQADYASPGCDAHHDPACLCDVDVTKTADLEWKHAPPDLLEVETTDDLLSLGARMLLRLQFSKGIADRRAIPATSNGRDFMARYFYARKHPRFDDVLRYVIDHREATFEQAFEALGIPKDGRPDHDALGIARALVYPSTAAAENNRLERMHDVVYDLAVNEGLAAGGVRKRLAEMGHNFKYDTVYHHMLRSRLLPHQREANAA